MICCTVLTLLMYSNAICKWFLLNHPLSVATFLYLCLFRILFFFFTRFLFSCCKFTFKACQTLKLRINFYSIILTKLLCANRRISQRENYTETHFNNIDLSINQWKKRVFWPLQERMTSRTHTCTTSGHCSVHVNKHRRPEALTRTNADIFWNCHFSLWSTSFCQEEICFLFA